jgi:hypothetical protein
MLKREIGKEPISVINCDYKWESLVSMFTEWLETGTKEQKQMAHDDIMQMAKFCDIVRQAQKEAQKKGEKTFTLTFDV